jgi:hypothetical protein
MSNFHVAASREVASNLLFEGAAPRKRRLLARGTLRGRRDTEELSAGEHPPRLLRLVAQKQTKVARSHPV